MSRGCHGITSVWIAFLRTQRPNQVSRRSAKLPCASSHISSISPRSCPPREAMLPAVKQGPCRGASIQRLKWPTAFRRPRLSALQGEAWTSFDTVDVEHVPHCLLRTINTRFLLAWNCWGLGLQAITNNRLLYTLCFCMAPGLWFGGEGTVPTIETRWLAEGGCGCGIGVQVISSSQNWDFSLSIAVTKGRLENRNVRDKLGWLEGHQGNQTNHHLRKLKRGSQEGHFTGYSIAGNCCQ